jgi:hypothetical protein
MPTIQPYPQGDGYRDDGKARSRIDRRNDDRRAAELPVTRPPRAKKDRARWCRGKVGVEHEYRYVRPGEVAGFRWIEEACANCGRKRMVMNE